MKETILIDMISTRIFELSLDCKIGGEGGGHLRKAGLPAVVRTKIYGQLNF